MSAMPNRLPWVLDSRSATKILLGSFATHIVCGIFIGICEVISGAYNVHGERPRSFSSSGISGILTAFVPIASGIITVRMSRRLVTAQLEDSSPNGGAWVRGNWSDLWVGFGIGVSLGVFVQILNSFVRAQLVDTYSIRSDPGAFDQLAYVPGLGQMLWIIAGLLFYPWAEEILFRGVLYGGYRRSFGAVWAAVITTTTFMLLHLPSFIRYPPSSAYILVLSITALWWRLRSAAIGPAIALHAGYNAWVTLIILFRIWGR